MSKHPIKIRDIDIFDEDKYLGTIKNAKSYSNAFRRARKELNLPLSQSGYTARNSN